MAKKNSVASSSKNNGAAKLGLKLIGFAISLSILWAIVFGITSFIMKEKTPDVFKSIDAIILLISEVSILVGIVLCLFSGQKDFSFALFMYIAITITLIIYAVIKKEPQNWLYGVFYIMLALGHLSIILGVKHMSNGRNAFNNFVITISLLLYVGIIVIIFLSSGEVIKGDWIVGTIKLMHTLESIFFLLSLLTTRKALD